MKRAIIIAAMLAAAGLAGAQMFAQLFGGSASRLPAGYRECNYLESVDGQYIDTGYKPNAETFNFEIKAYSKDANVVFFGASGSGTSRMRVTVGTDTSCKFGYAAEAVTLTPKPYPSTARIIALSGTSVTVDGASVGTITRITGTSTINLWLFAGSSNASRPRAVFYYAKFWDGATLVRDFVPCLNASNVPGMYDLVGGVFYQNAGTGSFLYELK